MRWRNNRLLHTAREIFHSYGETDTCVDTYNETMEDMSILHGSDKNNQCDMFQNVNNNICKFADDNSCEKSHVQYEADDCSVNALLTAFPVISVLYLDSDLQWLTSFIFTLNWSFPALKCSKFEWGVIFSSANRGKFNYFDITKRTDETWRMCWSKTNVAMEHWWSGVWHWVWWPITIRW
jgi:hypothetical protein